MFVYGVMEFPCVEVQGLGFCAHETSQCDLIT